MADVSPLRLNLMRVMYALIAFAMGSMIWPVLVQHDSMDRWHGVGVSMLAALSLLAALGIRYPLQLLPVLLFELAWKTCFVLFVALPPWRAGTLDAATRETAVESLFGLILVPLVIPWGYVWAHYVRKAGERWRGGTRSSGRAHPPVEG